MKILLLITLPPPIHGVTLINERIAKSIILRQTFTIDILPVSYNEDIASLGKFRLRKIPTYFKLIFLLTKKMFLFNPNAVYFPLALHGINFYRDAVLACIIKLFNKKLVLQLNGVGIEDQINGFFSKFVYRQVFKDTYVIHLSKSLFGDLNKISDVPRKVYFVHSAIPNIKNQKSQKSLLKQTITFINVSNITPLKGQIYILKAVQRLITQGYTDFKVILIGQIQDNEYLTLLNTFTHQNHLENHIFFKGPLFNEERDQELEKADIFLFPTLREAFGLVAIEAMRAKLPVIASDIGSMREILEVEQGFLFPAQDDEKLSEHMILFLKNRKLIHTMGENAFKAFQSKFVFEKFEINTRNVFLDIIQGTPSH